MNGMNGMNDNGVVGIDGNCPPGGPTSKNKLIQGKRVGVAGEGDGDFAAVKGTCGASEELPLVA